VFGQILVEFLFRLTFGVAAAMGLTPSSLVTSGFFRVHLWVLLGVQTLAALALYSSRPSEASHELVWRWQTGLAIAAASVSYAGAVVWMYERNLAGKIAVWLVAGLSLLGCTLPVIASGAKPTAFQIADRVTGGLLLGLVTTAMLLGHWYLNTPTMKLAPLRRLIVLLAAAVLARAAVCGAGAWIELSMRAGGQAVAMSTWLVFLALRWLAGLLGVLVLTGLTWQTLKIPNTQSATGILYAAVVLAMIGELTSQLLSAETMYPV
jgi:hypothetical protein